MTILKLSFQNLMSRKSSFALTSILIAISVFLVLGIERIRLGARDSFQNTISQIDLVVGARTSPLNLVLFSVFRIGDASNNVSYDVFQEISSDSSVKFAIPISLGDSHRGFRVVGTNKKYFEFYKYGGNKNISFKEGQEFRDVLDAVVGFDVAEQLKYQIGDQIILSHGAGDGIQEHADQKFKIVGILNRTHTPVDKSVHVSLEAIEAIHVGWESGAPEKTKTLNESSIPTANLEPKSITAFFVGLHSRKDVFSIQRKLNENSKEALTAALPGAVIMDLWKILSYVENILFILSVLVFVSSLVSLFLILLTSLNQRRREMSILRSLGASPFFILKLYIFESLLITLSGYLLGVSSIFILRPFIKSFISDQWGLELSLSQVSTQDFYFTCAIILAALLVSLIPAISAYKKSVSDGLTARV